jgi:exonuclease SbcC
MIKKLIISNFQSHKDTEINFTPGLNCIVGSTHVGKSAIIRALKWVLFNQSISNFITWGQNKCSVKVIVEDGYVERIRDKNTNKVVINGADFNNFGSNYPKIVSELCKIKKLILDVDQEYNLNILSQHDPLFLLSDEISGSVRAKALNSLIDLNTVDNVVRDLVSDILRENKSKDTLVTKKNQLEKEIESYNNLAEEEIKLNRLKTKLEELKKLNIDYEKYKQLSDKVNAYKQKVEEWNIKNSKLKKYDINKLNQFDSLYNNIVKLNDLSVRLTDVDSKIANKKSELNLINNNLKLITDKYRQILLKIKQCPICYSKIDSDVIDSILEKI